MNGVVVEISEIGSCDRPSTMTIIALVHIECELEAFHVQQSVNARRRRTKYLVRTSFGKQVA